MVVWKSQKRLFLLEEFPDVELHHNHTRFRLRFFIVTHYLQNITLTIFTEITQDTKKKRNKTIHSQKKMCPVNKVA